MFESAYAGALLLGVRVRLTVEHKAMFFFSISSRVDLNVWENPIHAQSGLSDEVVYPASFRRSASSCLPLAVAMKHL